MIAIFVAALASQAGVDAGPAGLRGRCQYSEAVARFREQTMLVLCDALAIQDEGASTTFDFSQRGLGSTIRFAGERSGARMTVTHLSVRDRGPVAATGSCEIFRRGEEVSVVTCLARIGSRTFAANFVPSHL
jgi:hypothetical protein